MNPFKITMEILDDSGRKIGQWSWREISEPKDLFPSLSETHFPSELTQIVNDIREKIPNFPIAELENLHIDDKMDRRKGYGRRALNSFFEIAKQSGYSKAIVKIGKYSLDDSLEGNTDFYTSCGWVRFITPTQFSLRFAYYDLSKYETT
jgi:hypothetical protein